MQTSIRILLFFLPAIGVINAGGQKNYTLQPVGFADITVKGELKTRTLENFERLESDICPPEKVFPVKHNPVSQG